MKFSRLKLLAAFAGLLPALVLSAADSAPVKEGTREAVYKLDHRISMPGDEGWDFLSVDSIARRLYLTRGQRVDVLDLQTEKIVGNVSGTEGVHGVAIAADLGKGFSSNGKSNSVTVFNLKTLKSTRTIKVGEGPDVILYDEFSHRVFAFNGKSKDVTVIDAKKEKVVETVALNARPEFAVSDGKGSIYFNLEDKNSIASMDPVTMKLGTVWPLPGAESPSGLAIDLEHSLLFAVCDGKKMEVVDAKTGTVTAEIAIGDHPDAAAFDPGTQLVFSSNGEGNLTVAHEVSPTAFTVVDTVTTQKGAKTMALDPTTHQVYLLCARYLTETATAGEEHHRRKIEPGSVELLVLKKL